AWQKLLQAGSLRQPRAAARYVLRHPTRRRADRQPEDATALRAGRAQLRPIGSRQRLIPVRRTERRVAAGVASAPHTPPAVPAASALARCPTQGAHHLPPPPIPPSSPVAVAGPVPRERSGP